MQGLEATHCLACMLVNSRESTLCRLLGSLSLVHDVMDISMIKAATTSCAGAIRIPGISSTCGRCVLGNVHEVELPFATS